MDKVDDHIVHALEERGRDGNNTEVEVVALNVLLAALAQARAEARTLGRAEATRDNLEDQLKNTKADLNYYKNLCNSPRPAATTPAIAKLADKLDDLTLYLKILILGIFGLFFIIMVVLRPK